MHPMHRIRPGDTSGYGKPITLKIKGPMMDYIISSDNDIRKRKLQGDWSLVQLTVSKPNAMLEEKGEMNKISDLKNGKHLTCYSE